MSHVCSRPRFPQETKSGRLVAEISLADDFERHGTLQIDVERLISNPHRTATQLDRFPVFACHKLILLESLQRLFWCRLECIPRRRVARLNPTGKTLAEQAYRTEFHCFRKLITATQAGALGLRFHGSDRSSEAIKALRKELGFPRRSPPDLTHWDQPARATLRG